jgi:DNA-binding PucR family transcriptional regulator
LEEVHDPLAAVGGDLLATVSAFLDNGGSVEGTARALFVHANTVRYRLRKAQELVDLDMSTPRDALVTRIALVLGRTRSL